MNSKNVIVVTLIIIILVILGPLSYKIYKNHQNNLILVMEKEFLYQAKLCYNKDECGDVVYLKDLYQKNYIKDKLTNPLNKQYYSEDSYVDLKTEEIKLI